MKSEILMFMIKERLEGYKRKLEHERLPIIQEIKDFEKPVSFGTDVDHFDEKTDEQKNSVIASDKKMISKGGSTKSMLHSKK